MEKIAKKEYGSVSVNKIALHGINSVKFQLFQNLSSDHFTGLFTIYSDIRLNEFSFRMI